MEEINLYDLLRYYGKKWLTLVIAMMIGAIIGVSYTFYVQQPAYKSSATMLLIGTNNTGNNQGSVVLNNYVNLFTSRRVLDPVIANSDYSEGYSKLASNTTAENAKNTDIIKVSMSTSDPKMSKSLLESSIQEFEKQAKSLYGNNSVKITVVDTANTPDAPSNIKPVQQIGLTTIGALALAIVVLFFVYDYRNSRAINSKSKTPKNTKTRKNTKNSVK